MKVRGGFPGFKMQRYVLRKAFSGLGFGSLDEEGMDERQVPGKKAFPKNYWM